MSAEEYRQLGEEIGRLTDRRVALLEAEYSRRTGAKIGDLVRDTSVRGLRLAGRGRIGVLEAWGSYHWPFSGRDLPLAKVRLINRDGLPGRQITTFLDWEREPRLTDEIGAVGAQPRVATSPTPTQEA